MELHCEDVDLGGEELAGSGKHGNAEREKTEKDPHKRNFMAWGSALDRE
jgi:hypothetical protein